MLIDTHRRCIYATLREIDRGGADLIVAASAEIFIRDKGVISPAGVALRRAAGGDGNNLLRNRAFRGGKTKNANH